MADRTGSDPAPAGVPVTDLPIMGWKEQASLPELGITRLRTKLDTGAKSNALHVEDLTVVEELEATDERTGAPLPLLVFTVLAGRRDQPRPVRVEAPAVALRTVRDTGANHEVRYVVRIHVVCGPLDVPGADVTLTSRAGMNFRMLLGRRLLAGRCLVDPERGYRHTEHPPRRR